jgi:hypothetical protein
MEILQVPWSRRCLLVNTPQLNYQLNCWQLQPKIKSLGLGLVLMLRPTVSRPVYLGIKHPPGAYDQIFITVRQMRVCWYGALSLTRGRICRLQWLLALGSAVILDPNPVGLATILYCLRFETSLFVVSYDSQGYGGGIRLRLHTRLYHCSKLSCI